MLNISVMCDWDLKHNFAQYRVNYADIDEPQTPWRNVHGPKQMIVSTADLLQKWINCIEGLIEFLLYWNE